MTEEARTTLTSGYERGSETLLLVEDEEILLELLQTLLSEHGYQTLLARDGIEAVEMYEQRKDEIALVLSDMGLPRLGGWEAMLQMRKINPAVKIILASGYLDTNIREELITLGAVDFIQKPYVPEIILQRIRSIIDGTEKK